jgi:hypothetical protein
MSTLTETLQEVPSPGRGDWKETLGRMGLVGKGALYAIVGVLAIQLASGDVGQDTSKPGAIEWVAGQPFGHLLLVALTVCLFAMAAWRLLDAVVGDPVEGDDPSDRVRFAAKGLLYLAVAAVALITTIDVWSTPDASSGAGRGGGASGDQQQQQATATVLDWPGGRWIVMAAGLGLVVYALVLAKRHAGDAKFMERLDVGSSHWVEPLGRWGYAARSIVFVLIGWFLFQAGLDHRPDESKGISGALKELAGGGWGQVALWVVAVGLLAYGLFNLAEAKHRRAA